MKNLEPAEIDDDGPHEYSFVQTEIRAYKVAVLQNIDGTAEIVFADYSNNGDLVDVVDENPWCVTCDSENCSVIDLSHYLIC